MAAAPRCMGAVQAPAFSRGLQHTQRVRGSRSCRREKQSVRERERYGSRKLASQVEEAFSFRQGWRHSGQRERVCVCVRDAAWLGCPPLAVHVAVALLQVRVSASESAYSPSPPACCWCSLLQGCHPWCVRRRRCTRMRSASKASPLRTVCVLLLLLLSRHRAHRHRSDRVNRSNVDCWTLHCGFEVADTNLLLLRTQSEFSSLLSFDWPRVDLPLGLARSSLSGARLTAKLWDASTYSYYWPAPDTL